MLRTPRIQRISFLFLCGIVISSTRVIAQLPPPKELPEAQKKDGVKKPSIKELPEVLVTHPVKKESIVLIEHRACKLAHHREIKVYSSIPNGVISEVNVKEGQKVKKGEILFKLISTLYQAKHDLELAEVKIAQIECENAVKLFQQKVISAGEVELSKAKLAKAQAKARIAEVELNRTILRAPFDGEVGTISVSVGSQVKENEALTTLSDRTIMSAYFELPAERYSEYKGNLDQEVELKLTKDEKVHIKGKLVSILSPDKKDHGWMTARAELPNPDLLLFTGQTCTVILKRELKIAYMIPKELAGHKLLDHTVLKLCEGEYIPYKPVDIRHEGLDFYVLNKDVSENDQIIYSGQDVLRSGQEYHLKVLNPKETWAKPKEPAKK